MVNFYKVKKVLCLICTRQNKTKVSKNIKKTNKTTNQIEIFFFSVIPDDYIITYSLI